MLTDLYLTSASHIRIPHSDEWGELNTRLKQLIPTVPRRINRYIQVSLLGAAECIEDITEKSVDVFLCSPRISLEVMNDLLESVVIKKEQPKPVSFINSIGNAATFYVSQQLGLHGESLFLCEPGDSLAQMLLLSAVKIKSGSESVLIGNIHVDDEFTECSWLLLQRTATGKYLAKLSFEFVDGDGSIPMPGPARLSTDFKQLAERQEMPEYIGSVEFQRQSGMVISVS